MKKKLNLQSLFSKNFLEIFNYMKVKKIYFSQIKSQDKQPK